MIDSKRRAYNLARCQARYRNEPFELTRDEFYMIWEGNWENRGRNKLCFYLTRKDSKLPWRVNNVEIKQHKSEAERKVKRERYRANPITVGDVWKTWINPFDI